MKKAVFFIICCLAMPALYAQKCLDINLVSLMDQNLHIPGSAENCLGDCQVTKNEHNQTVIVNYGTEYLQLENMSKQKMMDFTAASTNTSSQDMQAMASKMQSMTDDQRKAYAMQMARQMQSTAQTPQPESADVAKLVMQTQNIVVSQLRSLDDELASKLRKADDDEQKDRAAVKAPAGNCPPTGKTGLPSCSCANGVDGIYWGKITNIENTYGSQKAMLLQSYIPRMKALVAQVDANIKKLHQGDDVKTVTFKRMLLSSQSSAFGMAFDITGATIENMRKSGAEAAVNKKNCADLVYNLGCQR